MIYTEGMLYTEFAKRHNMKRKVVEVMAKQYWAYVKSHISSGDFRPIRVKYLGEFRPLPHRMKRYLEFIDKGMANDNMPEYAWREQRSVIEKYIKEHKDEVESKFYKCDDVPSGEDEEISL